jgi:pyruvate,water dikinase
MGLNDGNSAIFKPGSESDRTTSLLRRGTAGGGEPLVLSLRKSASATRTRVGGKAANLGRMLAAGLPVPPGFCITTKAFEEFLTLCPQHADLCALLAQLPAEKPDGVATPRQQILAWLAESPIPPAVEHAVLQAWRCAGRLAGSWGSP